MNVQAAGPLAPAAPDERPPLGDDLVGRLARGQAAPERLQAFLDAPAGQALADWFGADLPRDVGTLRARLDRAVADIDAALSRQVAAIVNHPRLQALEAAWRGVAWLVSGLGPDGMARVRLLDCRWAEVARDLERAPEVDRSALFLKVYEEEFGTPGGIPFSMMLVLHAVRHRPGRSAPTDDVTALRHLSAVAAAAFTPMILDASPALLGADSHADLDARQSLGPLFRQAEYNRFHAFQGRPDARFVGLVAPRIVVRAPRRRADLGDIGFVYDAREEPLLAPGAFAVAHIAIRAFNEQRWPAGITGTVRDEVTGGLVTGLPDRSWMTDRPGVARQVPAELNLSDAIDRELNEAGIITLRRVRETPWLATYGLPSLHKPQASWSSEIARANERLSAMLNYILCVARFAHYIKVIGRDMIGSTGVAEEVEARLQRWLNGFTSMGDQLSAEMQARYPLQEARIRVRARPGTAGALDCEVMLKPRFQIDQAVSEFHLVTAIAQPGERQAA